MKPLGIQKPSCLTGGSYEPGQKQGASLPKATAQAQTQVAWMALSNFEYQLVALALQRSLRDGIMQALEEVELQKLGGLDFDLDFKVAVPQNENLDKLQ